MLFLMFLKMPIAFCMAFIGLEGLWYLKGISQTLPLMALGPWMVASHWSYSVIATFVLMGMFAFHSGISKDLYDSGYKWFGHQPGGLALTTVAACGGFASICGCSTATAATMATIALPEMQRFNYKPSLSTGSVAAGGTLGILIPPSLGFMVYGVITEESIGKLFIAGIIPGIILLALFMLAIYIPCRMNRDLGPSGPRFGFVEKIYALRKTWAMLLLFLVVMGGLYFGVFGPSDAGAIGAFGALAIGLVMGRLSWNRIMDALLEAGRLTAMIFMILCCVKILSYFIALTKIPFFLSDLILSYQLSAYWVLLLIFVLYLILGMLMNIIPMMILTLPIIFPMVIQVGFDPIWFGVVMVVMMEMGQITPPVGINVFVVSGVAPNIPMGSIFKGIIPFVFAQCVLLIFLVLFPKIATFLPGLMG
jgi:tripartite ATP-independent transporter DctM subunit